MPHTPGTRRSVQDLQDEYDAGNKGPLEDVVRAWKGIKELPADDPRSFFMLGGYHGEPFILRPEGDKYMYWGGYCNHGNVLFPTWHRIYVLKIEEALQSIVPGVMLPFWDQTSDTSLVNGIPKCLTDETFQLDGVEISNPLKSFVLPQEVRDDYWGDNQDKDVPSPYYKPKGYETVRYPLSGIVGSPEEEEKSAKHNAQFPDPAERTQMLNDNVVTWLNAGPPTPEHPSSTGNKPGILARYLECLKAPNFTVFSNSTSMAAWNKANPTSPARALEDPHNDIHLSVGGFYLPLKAFGGAASDSGQIAGANGDMGENNTAALDPIFFFHHCNVDRMFWLWQQHNPDKAVEIEAGYPGSNSNDSQGPTPGVAPDTALTMDSALTPFRKDDGSDYTSRDAVEIDALGYAYGPGSLEDPRPAATRRAPSKMLTVKGINRAHLPGSFVITAGAKVMRDGAQAMVYLGHQSVLSRWNVEGCANCQTHLDVEAQFSLEALTPDEIENATFEAHITHRHSALPDAVKLELSVDS